MTQAIRETLEDFVIRRMAEIDEEMRELHQAILNLEDERRKMEVAFHAASSFKVRDTGAPSDDIDANTHSMFKRASPVAPEKTIKQAVIEILRSANKGMTALEILPAINARLGVDYPRTSLSPQLSRLKNDGIIERKGIVWFLKRREIEPARALDLESRDKENEDEPKTNMSGSVFD